MFQPVMMSMNGILDVNIMHGSDVFCDFVEKFSFMSIGLQWTEAMHLKCLREWAQPRAHNYKVDDHYTICSKLHYG